MWVSLNLTGKMFGNCRAQRLWIGTSHFNNNNNHDTVYSAVIMVEPLWEFHMMNTAWRQAA